MRQKWSYIFFVLLFLLAGPLCRLQTERGTCRDNEGAPRVLSQAGIPAGAAPVEYIHPQPVTTGRTGLVSLLRHSFFASEILGDVFSQSADHKALTRTLSFAGHCPCARPAVPACVACDTADLPAGGVDYYIYMLGKIRI